MRIYVPHGDTPVSREENAAIAELVGEAGVDRLAAPLEPSDDLSWLQAADSMVAGATDLSDVVERQAWHVATALGKDVLLLCRNEERQRQAIERLGELNFSIVFPSRKLWPLAIANHVAAQQMRSGARNITDLYSITGAVLDKVRRNPSI